MLAKKYSNNLNIKLAFSSLLYIYIYLFTYICTYIQEYIFYPGNAAGGPGDTYKDAMDSSDRSITSGLFTQHKSDGNASM